MSIPLQPADLADNCVRLIPLLPSHFETLYQVAADPLIWEQHPNPDRYKRVVFQNYFTGALASGGAFIIYDQQSGAAIGSSRFYDYDPGQHAIKIGYTFFSRSCWGKGYNPAVKALMLEYIFPYVEAVYFHVGHLNFRSQAAMEKLGAEKIRETEVAYYGEPVRTNIEYRVTKQQWMQRNHLH